MSIEPKKDNLIWILPFKINVLCYNFMLEPVFFGSMLFPCWDFISKFQSVLTFDESHCSCIWIRILSFLDRFSRDVDGRAEHGHVDQQHDGHGSGEGPDQPVFVGQPTSEIQKYISFSFISFILINSDTQHLQGLPFKKGQDQIFCMK